MQTLGQLNTAQNHFVMATGFHNDIAIVDCTKYILLIKMDENYCHFHVVQSTVFFLLILFCPFSSPEKHTKKQNQIQITNAVHKIFECNDLHISLTLFIKSGK